MEPGESSFPNTNGMFQFNRAVFNISCSQGMDDPCGFLYMQTRKGQQSHAESPSRYWQCVKNWLGF